MAVRPPRTDLSPIAVIAAVLLAVLAGDGHSKVAAPSTTTVAHGLAVPDPAGHQTDASHAEEIPRFPTRADDGAASDGADGRHRYGAPEIVFVDPSVGDREALLRSLRPAVERFVLDPGRDGVRQMARLLRGRRGVKAIHIISHGEPGTLDLGAGVLDASRPPQAGAHALAALGAALAEDGDILIYGCGFGAGQTGRAAVRALARATGADVAASDDSTGAAALGGDWDLEVREGEVAARSVVAVAEGWPGILQPRSVPKRQPINISVSAYTNTLVFSWELAPEPRAPYGGSFVSEYRVFASGETFKPGGSTGAASPGSRFVQNWGFIDGLEPDTSYEIRIRWQYPAGSPNLSEVSPWSLFTVRTKPALQVDLRTARTLAGQDSFEGVDMTATWDTFLGTPRHIGDLQFLSLRRKGDSGHIRRSELRNYNNVDLTSGRGFGTSGLLRADTEYEVRLVVVTPLFAEGVESHSRTYVDFPYPYFGQKRAAFDVSEWVPVGPNAPPRFVEATWSPVWGEGRRALERSITEVTEGGVLYCVDLERLHSEGEVTIKCPPAKATDPDGDTLTYWIPEEKGRSHASDKFEIDVSTGELRAKARGVADLAASLRPGEEYGLIAHVDDGRGGLDRMLVRYFLPSPLPIIKEPRSVLLFPSASDALRRQGFVRVVNRDDAAGTVRIEAIDEAGTRYGPLTLEVGAHRTVHFNSADLERGNPGKGLDDATGPGEGPWRLVFTSDLDLEVLAYVRTEDGFLTSMHDLAPRSEAGYRVAIFNPGRNTRQVSRLRLVNPGAEPAEVTIVGIDDSGTSPGMPVVVSLPPGAPRTLTARELESGEAPGLRGALGTGAGKWRLVVTSGQSIQVMNLLSSPTGHLTNLSTAPVHGESDETGDATVHSVAMFPSASDALRRQGFVRVVNRDDAAGTVRIDAIDEAGTRYGPLTLEVGGHRTVHFNSADLERGNPGKGLDGATGPGEGPWRLVLTSDLDLEVLAYVRTEDGFLTSMHDLAPRSEAGHRVAIFNPGRNTRQVSRLRLVNPGAEPAEVTIVGIDDSGGSPGTPVVVSLPPGASRTLTARELESGEAPGLHGALGTGAGKWRLMVTSDQSIQVMNLLSSPTGHLTNLSTTPSAF